MKNNVTSPCRTIDGLQSIPRESNDKDVAAMLDELTIEAGEESFVIAHQCGGNGVTCKRSIYCTQCLIGRGEEERISVLSRDSWINFTNYFEKDSVSPVVNTALL